MLGSSRIYSDPTRELPSDVVLYRALARHLGMPCDAPGAHRDLRGDLGRVKAVEFIDQNPIGKSSLRDAGISILRRPHR